VLISQFDNCLANLCLSVTMLTTQQIAQLLPSRLRSPQRLPQQQSLRNLLTSPPSRVMTLRLRIHTLHTLPSSRTIAQVLIMARSMPTLSPRRRHPPRTMKSPGQERVSRKTGKSIYPRTMLTSPLALSITGVSRWRWLLFTAHNAASGGMVWLRIAMVRPLKRSWEEVLSLENAIAHM
jgi:hypothetical protein